MAVENATVAWTMTGAVMFGRMWRRISQTLPAPTARAEDAGDRNRQDDRRQPEQDVHEPHDQRVGPAAVEAGQQPEHGAADQRDADRHDPDVERYPRAVDHSAEDVAPEVVGAEQV